MTQMDFSVALTMLKGGHKLSRIGWNGKNLNVRCHLIPPANYTVTSPFFTITKDEVFFDMWVPSVKDIMANDWVIVRESE